MYDEEYKDLEKPKLVKPFGHSAHLILSKKFEGRRIKAVVCLK